MNTYLLLVLFQIKHYLADFPLQTGYMLGKGKKGTAWILPLIAHSGVHAIFTLVIALLANPRVAWVALLDFTLHFIIDRVKALYKLKEGTWEAHERPMLLTKYYAAFGKDQLAHQLTYILIAYLILN